MMIGQGKVGTTNKVVIGKGIVGGGCGGARGRCKVVGRSRHWAAAAALHGIAARLGLV